jgi:DNA invertase Pin-like site-specific DNA recombinase
VTAIYGYARVSTDGQTLDAQEASLRTAGAQKMLARAMAALEPGDILLVTRLDRLARSTRDLLNVLAAVAERGAGFRSLGDPGRTRQRRMGD